MRRVSEAAAFIGEDDRAAARKWVRDVFDAARPLTRHPEMGRMVPELARPEIREILLGEYRIVYRVAHRSVEILTVRHGRRRFSFAEIGLRR